MYIKCLLALRWRWQWRWGQSTDLSYTCLCWKRAETKGHSTALTHMASRDTHCLVRLSFWPWFSTHRSLGAYFVILMFLLIKPFKSFVSEISNIDSSVYCNCFTFMQILVQITWWQELIHTHLLQVRLRFFKSFSLSLRT